MCHMYIYFKEISLLSAVSFTWCLNLYLFIIILFHCFIVVQFYYEPKLISIRHLQGNIKSMDAFTTKYPLCISIFLNDQFCIKYRRLRANLSVLLFSISVVGSFWRYFQFCNRRWSNCRLTPCALSLLADVCQWPPLLPRLVDFFFKFWIHTTKI